MKRNIFALLAIAALSAGCWDIDTFFEKTAVGNNFLAFTLNTTRIYQRMALYGPITRYATYSLQDEKMVVAADLSHKIFNSIYIILPLSKVSDGAEIIPDIRLQYLLLPEIKRQTERSNGEIAYVIDRQNVYKNIVIEKCAVSIRSWNPEKHIVAGDFTFKGYYVDSLAKKHFVQVKDGVFDVSDENARYFESKINSL